MQSEKAKLTFTEIKRECFQAPGKPWIHDKPATFEVDGRDATVCLFFIWFSFPIFVFNFLLSSESLLIFLC